MTETTAILPSYEEVVSHFDWETVIAHFDWPVNEKFNFAHEICDRWANDPAKAEQVALYYETRDGTRGSYTYRQLRDLSNRFANVLAGFGVKPGDRVGGLLPKIPALLPTILGIWKLGAIYVPLFTAFAAPAVAYRLRHGEVSVVVTDEANLPKIHQGQQSDEGLPLLKQVLVTATEESKTFEHGETNFWAAVQAASPHFQVAETTLDDVLVCQYTSGSTGQPKGALDTNRFPLDLLLYVRYAMDIRDDDVFWGPADPGWAYGLFACLTCPLLVGNAALLIEAPFTPELCWQVIERYGVTNLTYAPTAYRALAAAGAELARKYRVKLRVASSAGEPLNPEVIEWFRRELGVSICDCYGQTELGMIVCNYNALHHPTKPGSMGRPMPGQEVRLVDGTGQEVPPNTVGQIAMRKGSYSYGFKGYWKEPEKTAALYTGEWHLSGDLARRDEEGYYWFEGRSDDLINSSGYRIGPFEIESALLAHPAVAEAAVISVPDAQRGEAIKAYVILKAGKQGSSELVEELQQVVRERVGKHAFPRAVEFMTALPKTESGKIQRYVLRAQHTQQQA
jgi:acetyl-CoA synthetase